MNSKIRNSANEILVDEITKDFQKRREERRALELQWRLNMNFFNGNQYSEITPKGDIEEYGKQYFWQEREVYNHIASIIETRMSKLARTKVGLTVRPASSDESDINSAKLSTQIIKSICEENELPKVMNTACTWSEVTGSCFIKTVWDADKGRIVGSQNGEPIREGDVAITVIPPYEIFPDNICNTDVDDCRSIIHAKAYHVDEIKDLWGVDVTPEDISVFSLDNSSIGGGFGYNASIPNIISDVATDNCIVIEKYSKPTKDRPNGRLSIVAGDKLVFDGDLPYINGADNVRGYPFSKIHCIERVGSFFGTSVIERMIPLQRAYNAVKNRKHEFLNRIAMGVLAVEDGSIDVENLEEEGLSPGKILVYRQGSAPPQMMDSGNVPNDFRQEEERILSEFITISGVSELSKYSQTYSSMSGKAISLLVEQDDSRLSIASTSIRVCVRKISEQILRMYRQFSTATRLKKIAGEGGEVQLAYFNGNDLQSEDIVFDSENDLSDTLASRRNMVLELVKMGVLHDENGVISSRNKVKILEMLGIGNWESSRDIDECHRKKAIKENLNLADGAKLVVSEFDDHDIHIDEHTKELISNDNQSKSDSDKLTEHIKQHNMMKMMQNTADFVQNNEKTNNAEAI